MFGSGSSLDFERVYQEHSLPLFRFLVRFTGDSDVAADAVQETFLRLVEQPPRTSHLKAWLFKVATNFVRETGRKNTRRLRLLEQGPRDAAVGDAPADPLSHVERLEKQRAIQSALALIPPRDRTMLLMRAEGFSLREIAEVIGTSPNSVGTLIARALEKLAKELSLGDLGERA